MANNVLEKQRYKTMLESLQQQDYEIDHIVAYFKFVVAYLLQQDGPNPGWRKANIEGPVYLVRRRCAPRYQLLVNNQFSTNDLLDNLHPEWELDCQKNYVFYKVEDPSKRIRGLWFHDDAERVRLESILEKTLEEIRKKGEPLTEPQPVQVSKMHGEIMSGIESHTAQAPAAEGERVVVTRESLRAALHALADDGNFLNVVLQKLKDSGR
uniref:mRNA-decapping enzyme-like protein n=1 Tax=Noctiluca scintillans TaxID=2966 RepID=A0A7S1EXY6_NOCSC